MAAIFFIKLLYLNNIRGDHLISQPWIWVITNLTGETKRVIREGNQKQ